MLHGPRNLNIIALNILETVELQAPTEHITMEISQCYFLGKANVASSFHKNKPI